MPKFKIFIVVLFAALANINLSNAQQWSAITSNNIWNLNTGNVGIGTVSTLSMPSLLSVYGPSGNLVTLRGLSATSYTAMSLRDDRDNNSYKGQVGIYGSGVASPNTSNMFLYNSAGGGIGFYIGAGSQSSDLKLNILNNGNVGIGVATPQTVLQIVKNDVSTNLSLTNSAALDIWNPCTASNTGGQINFRSDGSAGASGIGAVIGYLNKSSNSLGSAGDLVFGVKKVFTDVSIVQAMTIQLGGNVGIGNPSPQSKLDVAGDVRINSGIDDNHIYWGGHNMTVGTPIGEYAHNYFTIKPGGASQGKLNSVFSMCNANSPSNYETKVQIQTDGNSYLNGGNVGIGTTGPQYPLDVAGRIRANTEMIITGSDPNLGGDISIVNPAKTGNGQASTWKIYNMGGSQYGNSLQFYAYDNVGCTNGGLCNNRFTLMDNGNVGIGTNIPKNTFEVVGSNSTFLEAAGFYNTYTYGNSDRAETRINIGKIEGDNREPMGAIGAFPSSNTDSNNGNLVFYTRNSQSMVERLRINKDGNVSIGTTAADPTGAMLTVKGSIHTKEVIVDLNAPLADYVFKPSYKLMPLSQVEQYVTKNSHLPEIPSADEVSKNGMSMGEMQNKLLQKVEELTLYVIEQQKEINQLKQELKK